MNAIQLPGSSYGIERPTAGLAAAMSVAGGVIDIDAILSAIGEIVYTWEIDRDRLYWGGDVAAVLSLGARAPITSGRAFEMLIEPGSGHDRYQSIHAALRDADAINGEPVGFQLRYALKTVKGSVEIEETGRCLGGADGLPRLAYGVLRLAGAISHRARPQHQHILSRTMLVETLEAALAAATASSERAGGRRQRRGSASTAFMLAGLADLGHLNRTYGFEAADEVIGAVADRLGRALRKGDSIGRYSGNKIGVILKNCSDAALETAARRFEACISKDPIGTSNGAVVASIKLGAAVAPVDAQTVGDVLQGAEDALALAKKGGVDFVRFRADRRQSEQRRRNQRLSDEIIAALNDRRLSLAFQPIACTRSRTIKYHEGLVRLTDLSGALRPASDFLPHVEPTGLLKHIDMRVIELAVDELAANATASISINVDGLSVIDSDWLDTLAATLFARRVDPHRLIVEITETALISDLRATSRVIHRLHELGIRVALDDFGAGHTSFRTLRDLPIDLIKIDGAFMHNIRSNRDDRFFVSTLVGLAKHLGMKTVAEWVADEETATLLTGMGVDYLQGDLVGPTGRLPSDAGTAFAAAPCGDDRPALRARLG